MSEKVILIGGGGHARVVIDCIQSAGDSVVGILDDHLAPGSTVLGIPVLGTTAQSADYKDSRFVIAIGNNSVRKRLAEMFELNWHTVIHPSAVVSRYSLVGSGTVIMPNAVVNAGAAVGCHCIINTGAIVEHDNLLEDYVHISPGASLGGTVHVGAETHIGIGTSVKNNIDICGNCVIGAGAAVVKSITESGIYVGIPAIKK